MSKAPSPETNRRLQAEYRARKKALGHEEVRGIFLPKDMHAVLKKFAMGLLSTRVAK